MMRLPTLAALVAAAALCAVPARAGTLVFNADTSDPQPRAAFEWVVKTFQAENPDIKVTFNVYDHESYKQSIRNWLTSAPPDVVLWYSGTRMRQFSTPGLLADVSDLWTAQAKAAFGGSVETVTDNGKQYGVPYSYYQWGLFYRQDILDKAGVSSLKTWDDLVSACTKLKAIGVEPIDIGSKELWPTAGWFDYLDLRINGFDFHKKLTDGKVSWEDARVKAVFAKWRELLDKGCFVKNHTSLAWQESQSLLYQGKSAIMLIGNFITQGFPPEIAGKMQFAPFPQIVAGVPDAEEAPMESINIPAQAKNVPDAKKFLAFMMRADVQTEVNRIEKQISPNSAAAAPDDRFLKAGQALLNSAANVTQFLDRDTSEDLATVAMKGFQEFMVKPDRIDSVLANVEKARKRIYGAL
jgi:multiple sugar transport system substrate-binding protein